jgi:uncharacterized protein YecE (DUF72 family)
MPAVSRRSRRRAARAGIAHVGCSGWHYKSWRGVFYPEDLATAKWLEMYSRRFATVELNNSFYRLPAATTFQGWREQVPPDFHFAMKASRFLTHIKRLRDPEEPLARLLSHARPLGNTLRVVLYQLPPNWVPDPDRLDVFLAALPARLNEAASHRLHHVIELRDPRGYEPWVIDRLNWHGVSLCVHDMAGSETPHLRVGPIVYVRFHGYGAKYGGSYPDAALRPWADWIRGEMSAGRDAYVYFNNDIDGHAVRDAERFRRLVTALAGGASNRKRLAVSG